MGIKKNILFKIAKKMLKFVLIFSIVIAFIMFVFAGFSYFCAKTKFRELRDYDGLIWPIVMQDPEPFGGDLQPKPKMMIKAAIWRLAEVKKGDTNAFDTDGKLIISKKEIDETTNKLFGKTVELKNEIINDIYFVDYDEKRQVMLIDSVSCDQNFIPETLNCLCENDKIILNVAYVLPETEFSLIKNLINKPVCEKQMKYILDSNTKNLIGISY